MMGATSYSGLSTSCRLTPSIKSGVPRMRCGVESSMRRRLSIAWWALMVLVAPSFSAGAPDTVGPPPELDRHLAAIAALARLPPVTDVPAGWFIMGTKRKDDDPYGLATQYDDTELPQRRVWLDAFVMDRDEVSMAEYLAFVLQEKRTPPEELRRVIWHVITVHSLPDYVIASWPVIYVTWSEATDFCS